MNRSCFHCGAAIELTDAHCPYCAAVQSKPGDPFIGFLLHHAIEILLVAGVVVLGFACPIALLLTALF